MTVYIYADTSTARTRIERPGQNILGRLRFSSRGGKTITTFCGDKQKQLSQGDWRFSEQIYRNKHVFHIVINTYMDVANTNYLSKQIDLFYNVHAFAAIKKQINMN